MYYLEVIKEGSGLANQILFKPPKNNDVVSLQNNVIVLVILVGHVKFLHLASRKLVHGSKI